ncbi:MAG: hypothetical protein KJ048_00160 [Dehalococcoidia bacterium]|nr:hypothetical protein [Dehalococcoidia bacterium]
MNGTVGIALALGWSALMLAAACGGSDDESPPTTTATITSPTANPTASQPTATPGTEAEVIAAYLRYWDLYAEAVLNLDHSVLMGAASEEELQQVKEEIETFRAQGVALRVVIEHRPTVIELTDTTATVFDEMTNNSFYVDPETHEPPEGEGSGETLVDTFFLEKVDGQWIVIRSIRQN